ncbi:hypothetical protein DIPPA_09986 [Diplonema papillatum]|nr:hypothetical protein DIPPA_09980 [Diplonema papillatum]KAJ9464528.1 hypothetical protein DIPPA_09986 [Diplonema papillatum]
MTTRGFVAALLGAACVVEVAGQAETPAPTVFRLGITTTRYRNESEGATFTDYPDFDSMTPYRTRNWDLDFNSVDLAWGADDYGNLASRSTGYLTVTKAGTHSFSLENSAGSRMFIDGVKIIDAGGVGTVDLSIGEHEVRIEFYYIFQKPDVFLKWLWQQPGEEVMVVVPRQSVDPLSCLTVATSGLCQAETPAPTVFRLGITTTRYRNESEGATFTDYPDFDSMTPYRTRNWDLDFNSVDLAWGADDYGNLASRSTGYLTVTKAGTHSFSLENSAGSRMFIDGVKIIDAGGVGTVDLSIGEHEVRIEFYYIFQKPDVFLKWLWQQPGEEVMVVVPRQSVDPLSCLTVATSGLCQAETPAPTVFRLGITTAQYRNESEGGTFTDYPDFDSMTPFSSRNWDLDYDYVNLIYMVQVRGSLASRSTGYLTVTKAGTHSFSLENSAGSRMFIDGVKIIDAGGVGTVDLSIGEHEVRIEFYYIFQKPYVFLKWLWQQPGEEVMVVVPRQSVDPLPCRTVATSGLCQAETPAPTVFRLGITTTRYRNESEGATFTDYPDFDSMTPYRTRNWDLDFNSVDLAWGADDYGNLASRSTGYLTVTKAGTHSFSLENSAGSRMFIDGVKIIDAGGVGTVDLSIGEHEVRIEFYYIFQKPDVFLKWLWQQPGEEVMVVVPRQSVDPLPCLTVATSGLCQGMRAFLS